ncbi:hypothetical protein PSTT_12846 [Puccinia striiformis]|uniref:TLC domain-containing protein n=1 Tax=Puccinia striiformis TaxID=27350 RepID=A0A2S4UUB9_9BASI|nr:hypothetical protein PSTT_12846 [Puccinia striiformis]
MAHIRIARTAPKRTDYHLAASFLFITATAALNLAFPKLSDEPTHPRPKFSAHTPNRSSHEHTAILARLSNTSLDALSKFYYLAQIAFWFQQIVVLQVEERRKDYCQMFTHHIVTVFLVCGSYATNFTGIGTAVHTTMDLSLFFWLPASDGPLWITFLVLLTALETIIMIWLYMILKVVWKVARGQAPEDTRSDTEDTDDEDTVGKANYHKIGVTSEKQPLLKASRHRPSRKMQ